MGHFATASCSVILKAVFIALIVTAAQADADDRCKDDSFCKAYCLSTNPDTVSARCGRDLASCICITPDNHAVKVRFIEERNPVPPTPSTTPRPHGVQYVNSQSPHSLSNANYNYNGNGNSIAGAYNGQQQPQTQRHQPNQMTPVLLECDASEMSTRMCHLFCTMEIRAWYGLCNITSKACACFGIPLSAVQQEPIAAIFHSTAPVTPAPYVATTTPKPTYAPPRPGYQQFYPPQQYLQQQPQQQNQQQWRPVQSTNYQNLYNNNQYYPASSPTILNAAAQNNQHHEEQSPVRSAASLFGSNGQPLSSSFSTPNNNAADPTTLQYAPVSSNGHLEQPNLSSGTVKESEESIPESSSTESIIKATRKRRSLNAMVGMKGKGKGSSSDKDFSSGECSKFKCAISCKRNNYLAPDCEPKCIDGQCWCECFPRL